MAVYAAAGVREDLRTECFLPPPPTSYLSPPHTTPSHTFSHQVANQKFADVVLDAYEEGDIIWVQVGGQQRVRNGSVEIVWPRQESDIIEYLWGGGGAGGGHLIMWRGGVELQSPPSPHPFPWTTNGLYLY